ncbi:unnamed protein product [Laminaria digitata]
MLAAGAAAAFAVFLGHHLGQAFFVRTAVGGLGGGARALNALQQGRRAPSSRSTVVRERLTATMTPEKTEVVSVLNEDGSRKSGEQIRDEFFMAAMTGSERGLPVGSFLNDTVEAGPDTLQVSVVWQPFDDEVQSSAGSSLLKSAVDSGAMTIDNTFCLTGQCEACMTELDGEVVLSCMVPVPADGRTEVEALVCNTDAAWDDMMV